MAIFPLIFLIQPLVVGLRARPRGRRRELGQRHLLLVHARRSRRSCRRSLAAYAVVGERQQGTLEPVLDDADPPRGVPAGQGVGRPRPVGRDRLRRLRVLPRLRRAVRRSRAWRPRVLRGPDLLAQVLFTPLLAAWSIWVGIAISTRVERRPRRPAAQHPRRACPPVVVTSLIAFDVIHRDARPGARPRPRSWWSPTRSAGGSCRRCSTASG